MLHLPQTHARAVAAARARPPSAIGTRGRTATAQPLVSASVRRGCSASSSSFAPAPQPMMATAASSSTAGPSATPRHRHHHHHQPRRSARAAAFLAPAIDAAAAAPSPPPPKAQTFDFACPICHTTPFRLPRDDPYSAPCACARCGRTFLVDDMTTNGSSGNGGGGNAGAAGGQAGRAFVDLTLESGARPAVFEQKSWVGTELFRTDTVSSIYEKGWRQGFARAGFPGPQREYDLAMRYFEPVLGGGPAQEGDEAGSGENGGSGGSGGGGRPVLVDASCGTGLFTRLFARSGAFSGVVALDYSETMLRETRRLLAASSPAPPTPVVAVRADIARLPFATGSVRAIHAGAALHCWPNPSAAMAEVSRVLAPGGVFVASTFLNALAPLGAVVGDARVRPLTRLSNPFGLSSSFRSWEEAELVDLCREVGLVGYERERDASFILFSARKPTF